MTPEPTIEAIVGVEAPLEFVSLATLWPYALAFLVVLVMLLLVKRRSR